MNTHVTAMRRGRLGLAALGAGLAVAAAGAGSAGATPSCTPTIGGPSTLPSAELGSSYAYTVPGTCSPTWSVSHGSLPSGLSLNPSSGLISGTPDGSVATAAITLKATAGQKSTTRALELPVVRTVTVDSTGGELTGVTAGSNLVYVAGFGSGNIFDVSTRNQSVPNGPTPLDPPGSHGTALTGLEGPAAVTTFSDHGTQELLGAQFRAPASQGTPLAGGTAPAHHSDAAQPAQQFTDGDTTCDRPDAVATDQLGGGLLVGYSCAGSNQVSLALGPCSAQCLATYALGKGGVPSGIAFDDVSVPSIGSVPVALVADARNNTLNAIIPGIGLVASTDLPAGAEPANIAVDAAHNLIYVADPGTNEVSVVKLDPQHGVFTVIANIEVGTRPFGVDVSTDGKTIVVTNSGDNTADVISVDRIWQGQTPQIEYTPQVGSTPDGVAIVGSQAFVANEQGGTVTVIDPPAAGQSLHAGVVLRHSRRHRTVWHHALNAQVKAALKRIRAKHTFSGTNSRTHAVRGTTAAAVADPLVAPLPR